MTRDKCTVSKDEKHHYTYDSTQTANKSVWCCICGEELIEYEDSQP